MLISDFSQQPQTNNVSVREVVTAALLVIMPVLLLLVLSAQ